MQPPVIDDITFSELEQAPYPFYKRMRLNSPVSYIPIIDRIFVSKAVHTKEVRRRPEDFGSNEMGSPMHRAMGGQTMMRKDGAPHLREREAIGPAFGPRAIKEQWLPRYNILMDEALDALAKKETADLFEDLAAPISARILGDIIGFRSVSSDDLRRWSQILIDGAGNFSDKQDLWEKCDRCNEEINAVLDVEIAHYRQHPNTSMISCALHANDPLSVDEIRRNVKVVIGGGLNEPRDSVATVMAGLLGARDQFEAVKADPKLAIQAFEEAVRWVAPIGNNVRIAIRDTELGGVEIKKDQRLITSLASANHDEDLIENADKFDIFRPNSPHQAFGGGSHFCMGTFVTRQTVTKSLIPRMLDRFPDIVLEADPVYFGFAFRGPLSVRVRLRG